MKLFFDGASRGNPGRASYGWVLIDDKNEVINSRGVVFSKKATNNVAEYLGLIDGLEYLKQASIDEATIYGDSTLVVNQVNGSFECKAEHLVPLAKKAKDLMKGKKWKLQYVPRSKNKLADRECNRALDEAED